MKHGANRRSVSSKTFVVMLALVLALGCAVGGTIAWLTAQTGEVKNTFTYGNINITLTETTGENYKIIPGKDIAKDPKVTVKANSETCYLFVKVEKTGTFVATKVTYDIANDWMPVDGQTDVYYREVTNSATDQDFYVLKDNKVFVKDTLTKDDIKDITTDPTLTFTAYAIQQEGFDTAAKAWAEASK